MLSVKPAPRLPARVFACFVASVLAVHLTALVLWNLPDNPLTLHLQPTLARYIVPLFVQQWNFFAPTPGGYNERSLVRYRIRANAGRASTVTSWIDVGSALAPSVQNNPFSPLSFARTIYYSTLTQVGNESDEWFAMSKLDKKYTNALIPSDRLPVSYQELARFYAAVAVDFCLPSTSAVPLDEQFTVERIKVKHFSANFGLAAEPKPGKDDLQQLTIATPWLAVPKNVPALAGIKGCIVLEGSR